MEDLKKEIEKVVVKTQAEAINIIAAYGFKESKDKEKELKLSKKYYRNQLLDLIRQREKDLLARVREEVIGENKSDVPKFKYSFSSNNWREEQLKKLEIISEEVK